MKFKNLNCDLLRVTSWTTRGRPRTRPHFEKHWCQWCRCFQCSPGEPVSVPYVCTCSLLTCTHKPSCRCWAWTCTRSSARRCLPATCQRRPWSFSAAAAAPILSGTSVSVSDSWRAEADGQRSTTAAEQISRLLHTSKGASRLQGKFTQILQKEVKCLYFHYTTTAVKQSTCC